MKNYGVFVIDPETSVRYRLKAFANLDNAVKLARKSNGQVVDLLNNTLYQSIGYLLGPKFKRSKRIDKLSAQIFA